MYKRVKFKLDADYALSAEYKLLDHVWECINEEFESHEIHIDELID